MQVIGCLLFFVICNPISVGRGETFKVKPNSSPRFRTRPLLSGWLILYRGGGGGVGQRPKKSLCT